MDGNQNNNQQNTQNVADQTGQQGNSGNQNQQNQNNNQQQAQNQNQQQNNQNTGGTGAAGVTFTQEQVNRMMTAEKNQGRAAALRELGIDPNDSTTINMLKNLLGAMKTPEQQAQEQVSQQNIKIAEAEERAKRAEAKAEAMQLGMNPTYVDDAMAIIMSRLDDKTDVKTLVGELKTKYPVWFNDGQNNGQQNNQQQGNGGQGQNQQNNKGQIGQNGTGSSVGNTGQNGNNKGVQGIGARLAAQRTTNKKSSFWD